MSYMLDAIELHRNSDIDQGMKLRFPYGMFLITLGEIDELGQHMKRLKKELLFPGQEINLLRSRLETLGFEGKVSSLAPNLQFTFSHVFPHSALGYSPHNGALNEETNAGIVFARGFDTEKMDHVSSFVGALALTTTPPHPTIDRTDGRYTLAFMTQKVPSNLNQSVNYPFPPTLDRHAVKGRTTTRDGTLSVTVERSTPNALTSLLQIIQVPSRREKRKISLEEATNEVLIHFFIRTAKQQSPYFSQLYQPTHFVSTHTTN